MNKYIHYFETQDDFKSSSYYDEVDRSVQLIEGFTIEGGEVYINNDGTAITGKSSETTCDFDGVYVYDHVDSENYYYVYKCNEKELVLGCNIYTKLFGIPDTTETNSYPICALMASGRVFKIKSPVLKTYAPPKEITVSGYTASDGTTTHENDGKYFLDSQRSSIDITYVDNIDNPGIFMSFMEIKIGECFETGNEGLANIVAISGNDFYEKPWVSLCEESNDIDYVIDVNDNKYNYIGTGTVTILS